LTDKGRSLRGLMVQLKAWGLDHIDGTEVRLQMDN
jgi:DNA-binding HxlR family transcriptional regulator